MFDKTIIVSALAAAALTFSVAADAQQFGTADQAKAMLTKAIAAVKADKAKALAMFDKGEGGFVDRDIFPFCWNISDGKIIVTQTRQSIGTDIRLAKDPTGKSHGAELFAGGQKPDVSEVSYSFPKPGADKTPIPKVSFVTNAGDLGCAVGYYK